MTRCQQKKKKEELSSPTDRPRDEGEGDSNPLKKGTENKPEFFSVLHVLLCIQAERE
jgi:hypothetical protein